MSAGRDMLERLGTQNGIATTTFSSVRSLSEQINRVGLVLSFVFVGAVRDRLAGITRARDNLRRPLFATC